MYKQTNNEKYEKETIKMFQNKNKVFFMKIIIFLFSI